VRQINTAVVLAALVALVAVGCGSSSEAAPLSQSAFLKQGNAICAKSTQQREKELHAAAKEGGDEEAIADMAVESVSEMTEELGDLGVPKGDEKKVEAIVEDFEAGVESMEGELTSAAGGDAFAKANKAAIEFGLQSCAI
jgi:hypothetical protein